jgi:hypothetical protein
VKYFTFARKTLKWRDLLNKFLAADDEKESRFQTRPPWFAASQLKDRQVRRMSCRMNTNFHALQIERPTSREDDETHCCENTQGTAAAVNSAGPLILRRERSRL